ncbi:unnamed protein product [Meganyctiphanes norvegica]|uniref:Uncharacterized protein n=1 Tax=Meganyctiphanes norvegica TaxID=48144 RepID=A0AAV2QM12_MEGNR
MQDQAPHNLQHEEGCCPPGAPAAYSAAQPQHQTATAAKLLLNILGSPLAKTISNVATVPTVGGGAPSEPPGPSCCGTTIPSLLGQQQHQQPELNLNKGNAISVLLVYLSLQQQQSSRLVPVIGMRLCSEGGGATVCTVGADVVLMQQQQQQQQELVMVVALVLGDFPSFN